MDLLGWLHGLFRTQASPLDPLGAVEGAERGRLRLIVGLGNPGQKYANTRHNVGFLCVDELAERAGFSWQSAQQRTSSYVAAGTYQGVPLVLAKPQTFMNSSGQAACQLLAALQLDVAAMLIVYDDMDLAFGSLRLRQRGSAGTHNGMRSVVREVDSQAMPRLRIGIGQAGAGRAIDHVLGGFSEAEATELPSTIQRAADAAWCWATEGPEAAMNRFNG